MLEESSPVTLPGARENSRAQLWKACLLLALPFALCAGYLFSTGKAFQTFWGGDELDYHWPLMQQFARHLPQVELRYKITATTPRFHLLGACIVRLFGAGLQTMRFLNMLLSLGGVFVLFTTLYRFRRQPLPMATLLTAVFLSSCYFFGYSFRLLTDNMAIVFCLLAMAQLYRFVDPATTRRLPAYLAACAWLCLTILTRQSYMFLCLPCAAILLWSALPPQAKAIGLGGLAMAILPFMGLVVVWRGLVPPGSQERHTHSLLSPYAPALPLMLLGFYAPFFESSRFRSWMDAAAVPSRRWVLPGVMALAGAVIVYLFPLYPLAGQQRRAGYIPEAAWRDVPGYFAGWIYNVGKHLPVLHGNSLLFWVLLPAGLVAAAGYLRGLLPGEGTLPSRLPRLFLLGLLLSSLLNGISSQKYYDALVLVFLVWQARPEKTREPVRIAALVTLIVLFCGYHILLQRPSSAEASQAAASYEVPAPGTG